MSDSSKSQYNLKVDRISRTKSPDRPSNSNGETLWKIHTKTQQINDNSGPISAYPKQQKKKENGILKINILNF